MMRDAIKSFDTMADIERQNFDAGLPVNYVQKIT